MSQHTPAISIRQPWAELILRGRKSVELRSWSPDYRGTLWLHTGLKGDVALEEKFQLSNLFKGGYVGTLVLSAVVPMSPERWELWRNKHLSIGEYQPGAYGWVLSSPQRFRESVPGSGQLGLFSPSSDVMAQLRDAVRG
jgi:hypothetical protein